VLWGIVWKSTQALDPFNAIDSSKPPITIQVVALRWKWLFIYPKQDVATVNHVMLPAHTPVHFELTADGPVSAFWIPQLGSQIYAMGAMMTQLNIIADRPGEYPGRNVEINGDGYSDMTFTAKVVSDEDFDRWVSETKQDREVLDAASYDALVEPSTNNAQASYAAVEPGLFDTIMKKYMQPMPSGSPEQPEPEMDMYGM
jgi:cytochrome o ubiquinol oxidase subunit 2